MEREIVRDICFIHIAAFHIKVTMLPSLVSPTITNKQILLLRLFVDVCLFKISKNKYRMIVHPFAVILDLLDFGDDGIRGGGGNNRRVGLEYRRGGDES